MSINLIKDTEIIGKIEKMIMEEKIHILENTLSDTISFFSTVLASGAIVSAILIALFSWWLKREFDNKLTKVETAEKIISADLVKMEKVKKDINENFDEIKNMYQFMKSSEIQVSEIVNSQESNLSRIEFLEEENKIEKIKHDFRDLIYEVERKLLVITEEDLANYYSDKAEGSPDVQLLFNKQYFDDAKRDFENIIEKKYDIMDFVFAKDEGEEGYLIESILVEYNEAKGFLEELNKIKN